MPAFLKHLQRCNGQSAIWDGPKCIFKRLCLQSNQAMIIVRNIYGSLGHHSKRLIMQCSIHFFRVLSIDKQIIFTYTLIKHGPLHCKIVRNILSHPQRSLSSVEMHVDIPKFIIFLYSFCNIPDYIKVVWHVWCQNQF